jgi:eukaryotic-like serine/threonine-protein kinase
MSLGPGTRLGPYEVLSAIGAGGMGEVYRARDTRLQRDVAIKVLPSRLGSEPALRERFEREARAVAALNHPHICTLYDVGHQDGTDFLVMEYLDGETLAAELAKGAVPIDRALTLAIQITDALDQAHRAGIVHRDLKPGNIMLARRGGPSGPPEAVLLDFGLAKVTPAAVAASGLSMAPTGVTPVTAQGTILGTLQYMSPEQLEGQDADARTDIFACGAVLYEMLSGKKAFEGKTQASLIAAILEREPPPLTPIQPLTPPALDRVVRKCLAKSPDNRWQTARDLLDELRWIATAGSQVVGPAQVVSRRRPREYVARGLATAALLLAAGVTVLHLRVAREAVAIARFLVVSPADAVRSQHFGFAVAPDGETLAFAATGADGVPRIFVRRLDTPEARPLVGTEQVVTTRPSLFWAPDSHSLGFAKAGGLYRVDLDGSVPRRLCDLPSNDNDLYGGTWGSSGVIVFASGAHGLFRVPETGGAPTPLQVSDPAMKELPHTPWFLPDGRHVLFVALATGQGSGSVWAASIDGGARTRIAESSGGVAYAAGWLLTTNVSAGGPRALMAQPFDPEHLSLNGVPQLVRDRLSDGSTVGDYGFAVSSTGVLVTERPAPIQHQLAWFDRTGKMDGPVGPRARIDAFALSPDEHRVAAVVTDNDSFKSDLWLVETGRQDSRLTYEGGVSRPLWARDGRHVYFRRGGQMRTLELGTTTETAFENPGGFQAVDDVTWDNRYVVFGTPYPNPAIWVQRMDNPEERRPLAQGPFGALQGRVSPDGRWLAYSAILPGTGPRQIFVQPFDRPGDRIQVSVSGGIGPLWRDDSRELYYEGPEGLIAVAMSERGRTPEPGAPQKLFPVRTQGNVFSQPHNIEVAAHGQKFLVNTIIGDNDNVPLEVTLNWTTGLKK